MYEAVTSVTRFNFVSIFTSRYSTLKSKKGLQTTSMQFK